jgi:multidrug efflux system membrane fusion protein
VVNEKEDDAFAQAQPPQSFWRRYRVLLIVVAAFGLLIFLVIRHHQHQQQLEQAQGGGARGRGGGAGRGSFGDAVAVTVATVSKGDIDVKIPALGTITPLATVTVKTQISGMLQKIVFKEGQLVKAGDYLAQIDPRPYEAALDQAKGNLARDQAQLDDGRLDLKRYAELVKEDSIAEQQLDTQKALVDQLIGTVQSDKAAVESASVNLIYTHITSPVTGRVGLRQVDQGNYVTPGDTNGIVVVTQLQPISAIFAIPEDNVTPLMQRMRAGADLVAEAYDRGNSAKLAEGKVETLDNQIDTTTGTIKLRAIFDNKDEALFANQFVNIQLLQDVLHDQLVMPNSAVHRGAPNGVNSNFVYLVNGDNTVSVRAVTLGVLDGERVAVTKGLQEGDIVVTEGGDRLRDGAKVELPANTPKHATQADHPRAGKGGGQHRRHPPATAPQSH